MRKSSLLISSLLYCIFWGVGCDHPAQPPAVTSATPRDAEPTASFSEAVFRNHLDSIFCSLPGFKGSLRCNDALQEGYEIAFTNDPFKNIYTFFINFDSTNTPSVHFIKSYIAETKHIRGKERHVKFVKLGQIPNSKTPIIFTYTKSRPVPIQKIDPDFFRFISSELWGLEENLTSERGTDFDPEIWSVIGRKNGVNKKWFRHSFSDSTYYRHLQMLLTAANVEEYNYDEVIANIKKRKNE